MIDFNDCSQRFVKYSVIFFFINKNMFADVTPFNEFLISYHVVLLRLDLCIHAMKYNHMYVEAAISLR